LRQIKLSGGNTASEKALKTQIITSKGTRSLGSKRSKEMKKCFNYSEVGHLIRTCPKPLKEGGKKDARDVKKAKNSGKSAFNGPLPTPGGNKGLTLFYTMNKSTENA
jgi:hypothetical protein